MKITEMLHLSRYYKEVRLEITDDFQPNSNYLEVRLEVLVHTAEERFVLLYFTPTPKDKINLIQ